MNRSKINQKANRELKKLWKEKEIDYCEAGLPGCFGHGDLTNAHKHKRDWYKDKPDELLWNFHQVIRACLMCHIKMEADSELTKQIFQRIRGKEKWWG